MSRIGKEPVRIPEKVKVEQLDGEIVVTGPKGTLSRTFHNVIDIAIKENVVTISIKEQTKQAKALWGLTRTLLFNMVKGVSDGFSKQLEFNGVGYKASVSGDDLNLNLGFSHPINYKLPHEISAKVEKNVITISGINKELVGLVASKVRRFRPPEPYKGKGIRYVGEKIIQKAGKTAAKK